MNKSDDHNLVFNRIFIVYSKDSGLNEDDFRDNFERFGTIKQVYIAQHNNEPKGVTYIRYERTSEACKAAEEMHLETLCDMSRKIKVHLATDKKPELEIDVEKDKMLLRLFIHFPREMSQDDLRDHFSQFGEVMWMYLLKEKSKSSHKGAAFIKFAKQSQAASALEHCIENPDGDFRARWADVRKADPDAPHRHGLSKEMMDKGIGGGGSGGSMMQQGSASRRGSGGMMGGGGGGRMGQQMGDNWGGMQDMDQMGVEPLSLVNARGAADPSKTVIEALVPNSMTEEQVRRLFNIAPGLVDFLVDFNTGIVKCQYQSGACASYAKDSIDGMELLGQTIAVRFARSQQSMPNPAGQLQETMRQLQRGATGGNVQGLVQQLQQVTQAITQGGLGSGGNNGMGGGGGGGLSSFMDCDPVSSVRLPPVKSLMDIETPVVQKVFVNSSKRTKLFSNDILVNVMCRFGNLISASWIQGKRFGFAAYGKRSSAENAVSVLNDAVVEDNLLTVELSTQDDTPRGSKRSRRD